MLISRPNTSRPYYLPEGQAEPSQKSALLSDGLAMELLAYYRGEPVTAHLVKSALLILVADNDYTVPQEVEDKIQQQSIGTMTIESNDGLVAVEVDVGTYCRHFELIADLYEFDKAIRTVKLPFPHDEVTATLRWMWSSVGSTHPPTSFACMHFLRPKNASFYLYQKWPKQSKDETIALARRVGSQLDNETRMANGQLSHLVPDWDLYPVASWAYNSGQLALLLTLLRDYPSALIYYATQVENSRILFLSVMGYNSADKVQVAPPANWDWGLQNKVVRGALAHARNAQLRRQFIGRLGVRHALLDNDTEVPIKTFGKDPSPCTKPVLTYLLQSLQLLDSNFTEEASLQVMLDFFPSQE